MTPAPLAYTQDGAAAATGYSTTIPRLSGPVIYARPRSVQP